MDYFVDTPYRVINGNIVYAKDLNNPFAALSTSFSALVADIQTTAGLKYATDTGTANTYKVNLDPVQTEYREGLEVWLKPANSNTGASTINVNDLGAIEIRRHGLAVLQAGDILANYFILLKYSSGYFQICSMSGRADLAADRAETAAENAEYSATLAGNYAGSMVEAVNSTAADRIAVSADKDIVASDKIIVSGYKDDTKSARDEVVAIAGDMITTVLGTSGQINVDSTSSPNTATISIDPSIIPGKNKLINGCFRVNQEVVAGTVSLSSGEYGHDMWCGGASGCTYTFSITHNVVTLEITAGTLVQKIENINIKNGNHILSWDGTAQGRINSGSYGNSGQVSATLTGGVQAQVEFGIGTLSNAQLELAVAATEFEDRFLDFEEYLCDRYFQYLHVAGDYTITMSAGSLFRNYGIRRKMRIVPTISGSDWYYYSGNVETAFTPYAYVLYQDNVMVAGQSLTSARGFVRGKLYLNARL